MSVIDTNPDISARIIIILSFLFSMETRTMVAHGSTKENCPFTAIDNKCHIKMA
jgi:hypothetical protein